MKVNGKYYWGATPIHRRCLNKYQIAYFVSEYIFCGMMKKLFFVYFLFATATAAAQPNQDRATAWADSVLNSLTPDQRIAQLMVLRLTSYDFKAKTPLYFDSLIKSMVKKYNVGGICLFQGSAVKLGSMVNELQQMAQTPLMVCIDGEWGVGMRLFDSVQALPRQMMLGAVEDQNIVYQYGRLVARQCKRLGVTVNYAPVVDINNNPENPVINERSFGEDKYKVATYGIAYMKGMQDNGIMACAKHFPGHGDVSVDSHFDLPVINKSRQQLDSLELYPFREIFKAGVGSAMIAHLYIPAIDSSANRATSISKKNVTDLMRNELGYQGLTFTDAIEMQGVQKFFPGGEASVQSIIAGNDMLCLPTDVDQTIKKIKEAIDNGTLSWNDINYHCRRVLLAKHQYGGEKITPVDLVNITRDLNQGLSDMKKLVAENAITLLRKKDESLFPLTVADKGKIAFVGVGATGENDLSKRLKAAYGAAIFYFDYKQTKARAASLLSQLKGYNKVIIGVHNYSRKPENNFSLPAPALELIQKLQQNTNCATFVFGNPYAIKNFCSAANLVACYEDDAIIQNAAADFLSGKFSAKGKLPVTVCEQYTFGSGITSGFFLPRKKSNSFHLIDSLAKNAIAKRATPGCVIMAVKDGRIAYHKAFGNFNYDTLAPISVSSVYDMASVTKMCATTIAVMKLFEQGKISLNKPVGEYLPSVKGAGKENLLVKDLLLHQAGLVPFIPFYKEVIDDAGRVRQDIFSEKKSDSFSIEVAANLYMRKEWTDTIFNRILKSPLGLPGKYVYSDNDFIFLAKIVEAITGTTLDKFVYKEFYRPMNLSTAGFKPTAFMPVKNIAPSENEPVFRNQLIHGHVHDPGAAMLGGVAGHAGLFSNAYDMAVIMQMLLNGGTFNGKRYLQKETINTFTAYHNTNSRRGLGFDKPEKDNDKSEEPYPCKSASAASFGHSGFTGTFVWADPTNNLVYVFLSNRLTPDGTNNKLLKMNVRTEILEAFYKVFAQ